MTKHSKLDILKTHTTVVADTGDIGAIKQFMPQDATTNPSLLLKASQQPEYQTILDAACQDATKRATTTDERLKCAADQFAVKLGCEILSVIQGRVSTEIDARLSFNTEATVKEGQRMIRTYAEAGIDKARILVKIAATYEGIEAAKILESEGIHCNVTLMFNFAQALAAAKAGVTLISPFVGRIYDWYKQHGHDTQHTDPGVLSVQQIYHYYRKFNIDTIVMGASFRHTAQIEALCGCDYLTISPALLEALAKDYSPLTPTLTVANANAADIEKQDIDEQSFRWQMNEDAMATEKLAEGIRLFNQDLTRLYATLATRL